MTLSPIRKHEIIVFVYVLITAQAVPNLINVSSFLFCSVAVFVLI